jgi:hypothetical protein
LRDCSAAAISSGVACAASASRYAASDRPTSTVESKTVMAILARWEMLRECRLSGDDAQHTRSGSSGQKKTG